MDKNCIYCGTHDGVIIRECRCKPCDCEEMGKINLGCKIHDIPEAEEWDGGDEDNDNK